MADRRTALEALHRLLQAVEAAGTTVDDAAILRATKWKPSTLRTYWNKGLFAALLDRVAEGEYRVSGALDLTLDAFKRRTTQKQYLRDVSHACKEPMARALLKKASENMVLALEVFNRPSLENRLDAFVLLFCCAWEQFLKAKRVEGNGEESIFRPPQPNRQRETISLQECLELGVVEVPVRKNLERIKHLRDRATHLLMPEVQPVAARLFQAGVLNFATEYEAFAKVPFLPADPIGLFTLVGDVRRPTVLRLQGRYGDAVGQEILDLFTELSDDIDAAADRRFAIGLEYRMVFTKDPGDADIQLVPGGAGRAAVIIEKPRDVEQTHPLTPSDVVVAVNRELAERLPLLKDREARLIGRDRSGAPVFNAYDFDAVLLREGWKKSNNAHHHVIQRKSQQLHCYAPGVIDDIVRKLIETLGYLERARESLAHRRKKGKKPKPGASTSAPRAGVTGSAPRRTT